MDHFKMIEEAADKLQDSLDALVSQVKQFFNNNNIKEYDCGTGVMYQYDGDKFYRVTGNGNYVLQILEIDFDGILTMAYDIIHSVDGWYTNYAI